jgi:putative acetyltransferase
MEDIPELQVLFSQTIRHVCAADYTKHQLDAWAEGIENNERWTEIMRNQYVVVAVISHGITGFCTLENGSYIDMLFVHKDFQRLGIARKLYDDIEKEARRLGSTELTANVSKTARAFFENAGFQVITEQVVERSGVEIINFKMKKIL